MDYQTANDLILKLWAADDQLKAVRSMLDDIESIIADMVEDE